MPPPESAGPTESPPGPVPRLSLPPRSSAPPATPSLVPPAALTVAVSVPLFNRLALLAAGAAAVALVYSVRDIFALFATGFASAYVLQPLVERLVRLRVPRALAIVLVLLAVGVTTTVVLSFVVPTIAREITELTGALPRRIQNDWLPSANHWLLLLRRRFHVRIPTTTDAWLAQLGMRASELVPRSFAALLSAASATISVLEYALKVVIVLALVYYLLLEYHPLVNGTLALVPLRARPRVERVLATIDATMGRFVRGQALVMLLLGGLYATGLGALGVPAGIGLGIFAGLISFIPYLGFFIALGLALLLALLDGGGTPHVLMVLGYMIAVHVLDLTLITPRILGGTIGLSPAAVILALLVGAKFLGFVGLLVAIPLAAMLRVVLVELVRIYKSTALYRTPARNPTSIVSTEPNPAPASAAPKDPPP